MSLFINSDELTALRDLPFIQRITYLMGIKPYMDKETGIVGIKRKISYQSLREALYVAPIAGVKTEYVSHQQIRRAVKSLEKIGLIEIQSTKFNLILKCNLALMDRSVQNKADREVMPQADIRSTSYAPVKSRVIADFDIQAGMVQTPQADIPLNNNYIYIFLYTNFEKFWELYPLKKNKTKAFELFKTLNPNENLVSTILKSLQSQIAFYQNKLSQGLWVPNWKYPDNWLAGSCWEDEIILENTHATHKANNTKQPKDFFWESCKGGADFDEERSTSNIIQFSKRTKKN